MYYTFERRQKATHTKRLGTMKTITTYSIAKDAFDLGDDYATCDACGARVRHVVEIGGTCYGRDCAGVELGLGGSFTDASLYVHKKAAKKAADKKDELTSAVKALVDEHGSHWLDWPEPGSDFFDLQDLAGSVAKAFDLECIVENRRAIGPYVYMVNVYNELNGAHLPT